MPSRPGESAVPSRSTPPPRPAARSYDGEGIVVGFDARRCLHAAECVRGLPAVFEVGRRPWILPDNAPADEVADVIQRCPSGALQYHRTDGMPDEVPDVPTHVSLHADGVLHLRGDLEVATPYGPHHETRVMLYGCGATGNTPYCDHSGPCAGHG
ncbi:(4Fe-4S)-binding protein [Streptomyces sp. C11-1]|uniref:(4Fe-4S)-binding protein n=1 Tax=Streptomyces durocortorensis TaxID=2811104 RepID=A0ABY9W316_9ACTN|nr:(4Fe-4S)-binding protein [Streptomyces durocortorensis]WNF30158.1 (4Fe-4S)-binding protein [Streptomyces durocortorensis]